MAQYAFGAGLLWGTPLTDAAGNAISNPTPLQFGTLQDVSLDVSFDVKELFGQLQFAVAVGRGKGKITGKAKYAQIDALAWNSIMFGQTLNTGLIGDYYDTTGSNIPATPGPYTITPTIPGSGTWTRDLGVRNASGLPMKRVASAPATGEYSVSTGVYTFASADQGLKVFISFQYTNAANGYNSTVQNVIMGYAPSFRVDLALPYSGKQLTLSLPNAISTKLTVATKLDDFTIPEFDFSGFADSAGNVLTYSMSDL